MSMELLFLEMKGLISFDPSKYGSIRTKDAGNHSADVGVGLHATR